MSATHRWRGRELLARIEANVVKALDRSAIIVQREVKLQLSKHGNVSGENPSKPGTPPGVRTGTLRRSVQIDRSKIQAFRVRIGPGVIYGRIHELGGTIVPKTKPWLVFKIPGEAGLVRTKKVTMPPRPYLRPGLRAARARVLAQFTAGRLLR